MKQMKTILFLIFTSLGFPAVTHANVSSIINSGEEFIDMARKALIQGFDHTPRQRLLNFLEKEEMENVPKNVIDDLERGIDDPTKILVPHRESPDLSIPFTPRGCPFFRWNSEGHFII